jgi:hypothetical protein
MGKLLSADMVSQCGTACTVCGSRAAGGQAGWGCGEMHDRSTEITHTPQELMMMWDTVTASMNSSPHCTALLTA